MIEWEGWRVGLLGLIEREWLDTLSVIGEGDVSVRALVMNTLLLLLLLLRVMCVWFTRVSTWWIGAGDLHRLL